MSAETEISIDNIESSLCDRLATKLADKISAGVVEVELLSDSLQSFKRPVGKTTRISICYLDTEFDKTKSTDVVNQQAYNKFGFFIASKVRHGQNGLNDFIRYVHRYLIGFRPLGHEKMVAVKATLYEREQNTNLWFARVELSAQYTLVEFNDDPEPAAITEMVFNPPDYGGAATTVNRDTVPVDQLGI